MFNIIVDPYNFEELSQDAYADPSEDTVQLQRLRNKEDIFAIVVCNQVGKIQDNCAYCGRDIPHGIISVGNPTNIRAAMTLDAAEKISESPCNTIRPSVIKSY